MTEPDRHPGSERPRWIAGRGRPVVIAAGVLVIVLVSASLAFVLGGGLRGTTSTATAVPAVVATGAATTVPTTGAEMPATTPGPDASATPGTSPDAGPGATAAGEVRATRIRIERLGIDQKIIEGDGIDAPIGKAAHFPGSGWPGGGTNIYIYGHAREGMFIKLWDARKGDTVVLDLADGTQRTYVVTKVLPKVAWDALQYLDPTPTEQLTLQTSTSYYATAPRFVVIAVPQS